MRSTLAASETIVFALKKVWALVLATEKAVKQLVNACTLWFGLFGNGQQAMHILEIARRVCRRGTVPHAVEAVRRVVCCTCCMSS